MSDHELSDGDQTIIDSVVTRWPAPKTILIPKTDQGYGFTLRHFIFYPPNTSTQEEVTEKDQDDSANKSPSYKRKRLSFLDPMDTIFVKNVRTYSPAYDAGLKTGDRVITVNNQPVSQKSYAQVIGLIQQSEGILKLEVLTKDEDKEDTCQVTCKSPAQTQQAELCQNPLEKTTLYRNPPFRKFTSSDDLRERPRSLLAKEEIAPNSEDRILVKSMDPPSKLKTSTSYTSGLSVFREPWNSTGSAGMKEPPSREFVERRRDFETRAKENHEISPNRAYSFGLFYNDKTRSSSDLSNAVPRRQEHVLHPTDSQENICKSNKTHTRVIPLENRQSREIIQDKTGYAASSSSSSSRHSFPDSVSSRMSSSASSGLQSVPNSKSEYHTATRQYIPVVSAQPSISHKMSASVDSLDSGSRYHNPERNVRTRIYEQPNQGGGRTFIVKIGDRHYEGGVSPGNAQSEMKGNTVRQVPRYGTAFALTRSPMSDQGRVVSQKKFMFENGKSDNTQAKATVDHYKTEIDKITSHGKFSSVANRVQSFEKEEQSPSSNIRIHRRSSQERCVSMPPDSLGQSSHSSQQSYQDSAPIRIYVSQGSGNSSSSPIVEIVPMYPNNGNKSVSASQEVTSQPIIHIKQSDDVDGAALSRRKEDEEISHSSKPVRKPSFLAAVNASQQRYSESQSSSEHLSSPEPPPVNHSTSPAWGSPLSPSATFNTSDKVLPVTTTDDIAIPSTPIKDKKSHVVLRRKSETSPDDEAIKLQRRTSYLMATAKDRDSHKLSLDKTHSPSQSQTEIHVQITPHQKPSMRKLKHFFGEKTPRIMEATERRQDPASPLQEVTKRGSLLCKTDITDGKKASDRSWKPVWVELRGHALYISKEKKDPVMSHTFSFDDQPVSIKSCLVDIAHDYTKKKNVFRLKTFNGSEYLFQAEENITMLDWIRAIQSNNNPDADEKGRMETDLILRSRSQMELQSAPPLTSHGSTSSLRTSPQVPPKAPKQSSKNKLIKIPHSPSIKRKSKESKSWGLSSKLKSFRKGSSASSHPGDSENNDMFGVPLECCIPSPNNDFVPMIVDLCTKIVEARGLEVTGVYRVPGNTAAVNMMMEELNKGIDNMNVDHEKWCDVNVISSLLKTFFRNLPDPLITSALYQDFIDANRIDDLEMRMLKLKRLLHTMPEHHFETFKHLAEHLNTVASFGHLNKMDARNLAIVFGPTLIKKKDDDMTSIVRDMSDQCRIIESIILHNDWFFSSWDQDSYVPLEEGREDDEVPLNPSVSKMSCDEDDNTVNPRDIVSSIVQAANQKRKKSAPSLGEDLNISLTDGGFRERNIDLEIQRTKMKSHSEMKARSSPNLPAMAESAQDARQPSSKRTLEKVPERRLAMSHEGIDSSEWEVMERERTGSNMTPQSRHFSSDSLDRHEDVEMSQSTSPSFSHSTIEALRKIEEEARALREKEERKQQRDFERWKYERQRQEKTWREMDKEKSQSNENLMDFGTIWHSTSDIFNKLARGESKEVLERKSSGDKYDRNSMASVSDKSESSRKNSASSNSGGKYFVIQSSRNNSRDRLSQGSGEIPAFPSKRASSMERLLESPKKDYLTPHSRNPPEMGRSRSGGRENRENRRSKKRLSRSDSARRGSLDSLINLGRQYSHNSSDSEDGSDLLSDLTSTFDQKLQILVNPKYTLNGSAVKGSNELLDKESAISCLPPQKPLAQAQCNKFGLCSSNDMLEKQYRDPSLHRSPKDAKIGIAYRFERNPLGNTATTAQQDSVQDGSSSVNSVMYYQEETRPSATTLLPVSATTLLPVSATTLLPVSAHVQEIRTLSSNMYGSKEIRPSSKLERTEISIPIHRQQEKTPQYRVRYERSASTPKDLELDVNVARTPDFKGGNSQKHVFSPPLERRKEKRPKRRHTVSGTDDLEHFKALMTVVHPRGDGSPKRSAWDQLQPVVKDMPQGSNRSMLSWLQNERLRGSTPDLSIEQEPKPKFY